jgi:hypothetical protein
MIKATSFTPAGYYMSAGVDTYELRIFTDDNIDSLKRDIPRIIRERSSWNQITSDGEVYARVVIKQSQELVTLLEAYKYMLMLKHETGYKIQLNRIDISCDTSNHLNNEIKDFRLLMDAIALNRGLKGYFKTLKEDDSFGNLKITNSNPHIVVYDCTDKPRKGDIRLEYRAVKLYTQQNDFQKISRSALKVLTELRKMPELLSEAEEINRQKIEQTYADNKTPNLSSFVDRHIQGILTMDNLKHLHKVNYKGRFSRWFSTYQQSRGKIPMFADKEKVLALTDRFEKELTQQYSDLLQAPKRPYEKWNSELPLCSSEFQSCI